MSGINIYSIVMTALMVIFGFLCSYIKTKTNLINKAGDFINKAEEDYKDVNHLFIWHGRYTCTARNPKCDACTINEYCKCYQSN